MTPQRPTHGGNLVWAASLAGCSPSDILDFSASINPLGPPKSAIDAIQAGLSRLRDYPDPNYLALRQALSDFHQLPIESILPGNGSAELLTWVSRELADLETTYLFTPAFADYSRALQAFGAQITLCALDICTSDICTSDICTLDISSDKPFAADRSLSLPNTNTARSGLLINNPHNPTGQLWTIEAILPYLQQFQLVVIDEAFMDFLPPPQQQSLIQTVSDYPNLVILRSLTKFYSLPGLRIGYAVAHPDRLQRWQTWRDPWSVNSLAAEAGIAVLQDNAFQTETWNWLESARPQLMQGLAALPGLMPLPGVANFLLVQSQTAVSQLQQQLLRQDRIFIRDCLSFPELGDRYFRVAVRTLAENQRLLKGLAAALAAPRN